VEHGDRKVLIVSLDGATREVLEPLMQQGAMPNLARMAERGTMSGLLSVVPPVTAPAWTSFMTGKQPSKHGVFDFTHFDATDYSWKINNSHHIRSKTLWQLLSDKGKRVIVLNLPYTYPPYEVNGIMVSGWDAPFLDAKFTYPAALSKEILSSMPDYTENLDLPLSNNTPTKSDELFDRFVGKLVGGAQQGCELASRFLTSETWDVCMLHLQQTDWMQHNLWVYIEEACRKPESKDARVVKTRECYKSFDRMLGTLLEKTDSANTVSIVLSDHGFGRNRGNICPNYYLQRWGYLTRASVQETPIDKLQRTFGKVLKKLSGAPTKHNGNGKSLRAFQSFTEMVDKTAPHQRVNLDWSQTKAALTVGSETGFVYVNVKGRGPLGIVEPGPEYDTLVSDLLSKFSSIRHPRTGEKLLAQVSRGSEIYPNKADGVLLPDIILIPAEGLKFSFEISDAPPELTTHGNHRPEGVLFAEGAGLQKPQVSFSPRLLDLAPTILHLLGLPVPDDMDGRVLQEILAEPREIRFEAADACVPQQKMEYNTEETELIEQRLKGLGYIE
jgi:predicted AlkP superfamily phosphohydrolase/phosphomutase